MANYDLYYPKQLKNEGGYVSAATAASIHDTGGETYRGISRNNNPKSEIWPVIDAYKKAHGIPKHGAFIPDTHLDDLIKAYSKKNYWDVLGLDKVSNQALAEFMADFGFNSGPGAVTKYVRAFTKKTIGATADLANGVDAKALFDFLVQSRVNLINGIKTLPQSVKNELIARTKSFFFLRVNKFLTRLKILLLPLRQDLVLELS